MQRPLIIVAVVLTLLIAAGGYLGWRHTTQLNDRIAQLSQQVEDFSDRVDVAENRATEAENRATEAEGRAAAAQTHAESAQQEAEEAAARAAEAALREQESAEFAAQAEEARKEAEESKQRAQAAREEAEQLAFEAESARTVAEEEKAAAEERSAEAALDAELARAEARRAQAELEAIRRRMEEELDRMERALGRIANTQRTALGLVMTLDSSQIEFDFDKADLRAENREVLSRITGVLLTFDDFSIQIFGHTDDVGTEDYNQKLSEKRAGTVRDYLVDAGIDTAVLSTMGLGKSSPLVEGTDSEARQRNRRVELAIVFSEGEYEAITDQEPAAEDPG